jgi:hypothetical protein
MQTLEELRAWLAEKRGLNWNFVENTITIRSSSLDGDSVWISKDTVEWTVGVDGWHHHFDTESEAVQCFLWILSGKCRIQVIYRGNIPYRWTAQYKPDDQWESISTIGFLFFPFWRKKRTEYRDIPAIEIE